MTSPILLHRPRRSALLLLLASFLLPISPGCGDNEPRVDDTGESVAGKLEGEIDVASPTFNIIYLIRSAGNSVKVVDKVSREGLGEGYAILVARTNRLEIYEYGSVDDRLEVEKMISPDGSIVAGKSMKWTDTPHFFHTDKTIVLYQGSDADNVTQLASVFGQQFAGR